MGLLLPALLEADPGVQAAEVKSLLGGLALDCGAAWPLGSESFRSWVSFLFFLFCLFGFF